MTYREVADALIAAGIADYAIEDVTLSGGRHVAFIRWNDLPEEGKNARVDAAISKMKFDVADKGILILA